MGNQACPIGKGGLQLFRVNEKLPPRDSEAGDGGEQEAGGTHPLGRTLPISSCLWKSFCWSIIGASLKRAPQLRVDLAFCHDILKTIGNRKGDCAWSCSRWQTQPEKICKSQRTNQCHSLRTLYWFVLCNLQIFSGCVCHLEQLHAQSPFLFPIVFSINLIPFFDICSVDLLAVFQPGCSGMCYFTWAAARSQQLLFVVLAAGLWCLTAGRHVKSPLFPQPPLKQKCASRSRWEKAYMRKHTYK